MADPFTRFLVFIALFTMVPGLAGAQTCENRCLHFDGEDDAIKLLSSPITTQNVFTAEAWVFSEASGVAGSCDFNLKSLFFFSDLNTEYLELGECDGLLHLDWAPSGPSTPLQVSPIDIRNAWHHVALVRNMNTIKVFLDCVEVFSTPITEPSNYTAFLVGHGGSPVVSFPDEDWEGRVDEVRVWDSAKDQAAFQQSKGCTLSGTIPSDLLFYWPMNEGVPGGDNSSLTQVEDLSGNGHHGLLTQPPTENFALTGPVSNFICSDRESGFSFAISPIFFPGMDLEEICSGSPASFCVTENGGAAGGGGLDVQWQFFDGAAWQTIADPDFVGFCFPVQPGNVNLMADCSAPPGSEERPFRPLISISDGSGGVCTWDVPEQTLKICCPFTTAEIQITVQPSGVLNGTLCEGDDVTLDVSLTTDPFATPPGGEVQIHWTLNDIPLPDFDNQTSFSHQVIAGAEDLCFEATLTNCVCPPFSASQCVPVDLLTACGTIESKTDPAILVPDPVTPDLFSICPGTDATLGMVDPDLFKNCAPVWQFMFPSEGIWKELGSTNANQNTNNLPALPPPPGSPYEWPAGETCIVYRIECRPLTDPSGCDPCHSNEITICLKDIPVVATTISGTSQICEGDQTTLSVDNPDPDLIYNWFCNGLEVFPDGPTYEASQSACYWAEASNGCPGDEIETPKFCLEVCEIKPIISCPLAPNDCPQAGVPITLSGCDSEDNCAGTLEYAWTDAAGTPLGTDCMLTHTPDPAGTEYILTVTNPTTNCSATASLLIVPCMGN